MSETFYVIDGHSQIFRAYYAPFRELTSPTGEPTKATYVFTTMLLGLLQSRRPDYVAMALDSPHHTLERCRLFAEYKATREAPPEDLAPQVERIEQIVRAMGIPIWQGGGLEADDYLATAADRFADSGVNVVLVSGDKDMEQLIGEHVVMYDPLKDKTIDAETMEQTKGYLPAQAVEIQILSGDSTDNVPGVRGIGPKTAVKLIQKYGSADAVVAHADELTPKQRENVLAFAEQLPITRQLITLRRDVDIDTRLDQYRWAGLAAEAVVPIFRELGFSRLISQIEGLVSQAPAGQGDRAGAVTRPASPA
ncbi:MAG: DNA polymerase I, partial [Planctomycetes bacterium]|nr:DNA polymerase I [Planctomycetota bacterium]